VIPSLFQDFAGLRLSSPLILASGPKTTSVGEIRKHAKRIAENNWAAIVTKSMISKYGVEAKPHLWSTPQYHMVSMQNLGPGLDEYSKANMKEIKRDIEAAHTAELMIIMSLIGSCEEEWTDMAGEAERAQADAIELNLSCPSPRTEVRRSMGGIRVGQDPEETLRAVQAAAKGTNRPILAKLTPHAANISEVAAAAAEGGASGISAINTVLGLIGIDIEKERPIASDMEGQAYYSGLSGPLIKPIALGMVAEIAMNISDIPISGIGGIVNGKDVVEYILVGASTVQVCTGVMWYGYALGRRLTNNLQEYMKTKGYSSIDEFRGHALPPLAEEVTAVAARANMHLEINMDICNLCRRCLVACRDVSNNAIKEVNGTLQIDHSLCAMCGLCIVVCGSRAIGLNE
jgi:dihydropyrimidine dehydrogenase (NAD+) subunit PreA